MFHRLVQSDTDNCHVQDEERIVNKDILIIAVTFLSLRNNLLVLSKQ